MNKIKRQNVKNVFYKELKKEIKLDKTIENSLIDLGFVEIFSSGDESIYFNPVGLFVCNKAHSNSGIVSYVGLEDSRIEQIEHHAGHVHIDARGNAFDVGSVSYGDWNKSCLKAIKDLMDCINIMEECPEEVGFEKLSEIFMSEDPQSFISFLYKAPDIIYDYINIDNLLVVKDNKDVESLKRECHGLMLKYNMDYRENHKKEIDGLVLGPNNSRRWRLSIKDELVFFNKKRLENEISFNKPPKTKLGL